MCRSGIARPVAGLAAAVGNQSYVPRRRDRIAVQAQLAISGGVILILGALLAIGGPLVGEDSPYHALAGSALVLAGTLIAKRKRAGAFVFMAVFGITLAWSLGTLQVSGSSLAMRLVGPAILLAMIALVMPELRGWRAKRTILAFTAILAGTIIVGISSTAGTP